MGAVAIIFSRATSNGFFDRRRGRGHRLDAASRPVLSRTATRILPFVWPHVDVYCRIGRDDGAVVLHRHDYPNDAYAGFGGRHAAVYLPNVLAGVFHDVFDAPPAWLREFEKEHSPFEVMLAINNAQVMLRKYPRAFRQTIRQRDGWELWLLTLGAWLELNEGGVQSPNRQALRDALAAPK